MSVSGFSYDRFVNSASQIRKRIADQNTSSYYNTDSSYIDFFNNWDVTDTTNFNNWGVTNTNAACKTLCDLSANCYGYITTRDPTKCYVLKQNSTIASRYTDDSNDASFNVLKYKCISGSCDKTTITSYLTNIDASFDSWILDISQNVDSYNKKDNKKDHEYYYLDKEFKPFNSTDDDIYNNIGTRKQEIRIKNAEYATLEDPVNVETYYYRFMILFILAIILTITFLYLSSSVNEDSELAYLNIVWFIAILMSLSTVFLAMYFT